MEQTQITGFNSQISCGRHLVQIQTEVSRSDPSLLVTHVFVDGAVLATRKTPGATELEPEALRHLIREQHRVIIRNLRKSDCKDVLAGSGADALISEPDEPQGEPPSDLEVKAVLADLGAAAGFLGAAAFSEDGLVVCCTEEGPAELAEMGPTVVNALEAASSATASLNLGPAESASITTPQATLLLRAVSATAPTGQRARLYLLLLCQTDGNLGLANHLFDNAAMAISLLMAEGLAYTDPR